MQTLLKDLGYVVKIGKPLPTPESSIYSPIETIQVHLPEHSKVIVQATKYYLKSSGENNPQYNWGIKIIFQNLIYQSTEEIMVGELPTIVYAILSELKEVIQYRNDNATEIATQFWVICTEYKEQGMRQSLINRSLK